MRVTIGDHPLLNEELDKLAHACLTLGASVTRIQSTTTDSVFHRDVFAWTPYGLIKCSMAHKRRMDEPGLWFDAMRIKPAFEVEAPQTFEGADLLWLDTGPNPVAIVADGARTTKRGAYLVEEWLHKRGARVFRVTLPHWHDQHLLGLVNCIRGPHVTRVFACDPFWGTVRDMFGFHEPYPVEPLMESELKLKCSNWVQVGPFALVNEKCQITIRDLSQYLTLVPVAVNKLLECGGGPACATGILEP